MTTTPNILQRLNAVMQEVDYIQREEKKGMSYKIVSHDKVTALVRPALVKHGIVYWPSAFNLSQDGNRTQLHCKVIFANMDDRFDFIEVDTAGYGIDSQDKGPGKAISYAVKYALLKALGLETGDDPELEEVEHKPAPAKPQLLTREKARELYKQLEKELTSLHTVTEVNQWTVARDVEINKLGDWKSYIDKAIDGHVQFLTKQAFKEAAE